MKQDYIHSPKYRPDIDGLRAVAVLSVVAFHAFPDWIQGGFIGVDIFFVISGFLISTIIFESLDKGVFKFSDFYIRRIKRIFPALLLVLFVSLIFGWFVLLADEYKQLGKHIAGAAGFVSNFIFWGEVGYFDNAADTKPLLHLWSLGIEEQFYIIWPFILWLVWKSGFNRLILLVFFAGVSLVGNLVVVQSDSIAAFYSPLTRFWELLFGSILAWFALYKREACQDISNNADSWFVRRVTHKKIYDNQQIVLNILSIGGIILFLCGFWFIDKDSHFPGVWAILPVLGTVLVISAGPQAWINRTILSNRIAVWFGLISYPLYLWHWPMLSFARIIGGETPDISMRIGLICVSVILAWLTYKFIERPVRQNGRTLSQVFLLSALCLFILTSGVFIHQTNLLTPMIRKKATSDLRLQKFDQLLSQNPTHIKKLGIDRLTGIRSASCHLREGDTFGEYRIDDCLKIVPDKLNVMIIGDSHAADFYFSLSERYGNINLLQATGAGCKVSNSKNVEWCVELIDYALDFAAKNKLDYVVLSGRWGEDFNELTSKIMQLRDSGKKIILVGPAPEFKEHAPRFIARRKERDNLSTLSMKNFQFEKLLLNERMRVFAQKYEIQFLDRISYFCNSNGICELIDDNGNVYILDYGHLTRAGAQFFGNKLFESGYFK